MDAARRRKRNRPAEDREKEETIMSHENAPATKLLATACACCGRALVDAVSVETGIGPECRKNFGVDFDTTDAAHAEANRLVFEVARKGMTAAMARPIFDRIAELGFRALADRIAKRFRATVTEAPSVDDLRAEYARIRHVRCYDGVTPRAFDDLVRAANPATPTDFVATAKTVACPCSRCRSTGRFDARDGGESICFRCEGKGYQGLADAHRNRAYDKHAEEQRNRTWGHNHVTGTAA